MVFRAIQNVLRVLGWAQAWEGCVPTGWGLCSGSMGMAATDGICSGPQLLPSSTRHLLPSIPITAAVAPKRGLMEQVHLVCRWVSIWRSCMVDVCRHRSTPKTKSSHQPTALTSYTPLPRPFSSLGIFFGGLYSLGGYILLGVIYFWWAILGRLYFGGAIFLGHVLLRVIFFWGLYCFGGIYLW
jgi:hypothetical protein